MTIVPSLTCGIVPSETGSSCDRKPKHDLSYWNRVTFRTLNCANIESFGFFLTRTRRGSRRRLSGASLCWHWLRRAPPRSLVSAIELTWIENQIEHWISFGCEVAERIIDCRRHALGFNPEAIAAARSIGATPRQITGAMPITASRVATSLDPSMERHRAPHQRLRTLG
jgi:hypothetical protein